MARPTRTNAEYFYHPATFRNDRRVKAIRARYGACGYGLLLMLIELLTDADNTALPTDEMEIELLAGDLSATVEDLTNLIQAAEKVGLFGRNEAGLLKCPQLDEWLAPVFDKRNRSRNTATTPNLSQPVTETPITVTETPPVKESKVQNRKVNTTSVVVAAHTDPGDLQGVNESPLVKPDAFAAILKATGYPNLDAERYRLQIAAKSEGVRRTSSQWRSRIIEFVNNDYAAGKLLTHPVLTPNEIPGNWDTARQGAYTAPLGMGIPHPSSYLKPDYLPK